MGNLLFHHLPRLLRHENPEVLLVGAFNKPLGLPVGNAPVELVADLAFFPSQSQAVE
jgi:hypothetical protein